MQNNLLYLAVGVIIGWILNYLMIKFLLNKALESFMPKEEEFNEESKDLNENSPWHNKDENWWAKGKDDTNNDI